MQNSSHCCLCCWGLLSFWLHPPALHGPQPSIPDLRGVCRRDMHQQDRKTKLCSEQVSGLLLPFPFPPAGMGQTPCGMVPHRICTIQQEQSTNPPHRSPWTAGAVPPPRKKPLAQYKKPLFLLCLLFMPLPFPVPNYHPVKLHSCGDFHLQTCALQALTQPHTTGVNGSCRSSHPAEAQLLLHGGVG